MAHCCSKPANSHSCVSYIHCCVPSPALFYLPLSQLMRTIAETTNPAIIDDGLPLEPTGTRDVRVAPTCLWGPEARSQALLEGGPSSSYRGPRGTECIAGLTPRSPLYSTGAMVCCFFLVSPSSPWVRRHEKKRNALTKQSDKPC